MEMPEVGHQTTVHRALAQEPLPQISSPRLVSWTRTDRRLVSIAPAVTEAETAKGVLQVTLGIPYMDSVALLAVLVTGVEALETNVMPLGTANASLMWKARPATLAKPVTST